MADKILEQPKWYSVPPEAIAQQLGVDPAKGLSADEAHQRLQKYGPNVLEARRKEPGWHAFLRQYRDFMQIILVGAALLSLASILRIPVTMHNLAEEQVFRPSAWSMFGAQDPMGADYRACANFGPIYGQY